MVFEGMYIRSEVTLIHVSNSPKKLATGDKTKPLGFQRVGPESR
jgi:hypothetical protein